MRAKFVPAEMLYPTTPQQPNPENQITPSPTYGTVDYSAFSQPPTLAGANAFNKQTPVVIEASQKEAVDFGSDFQIPSFDSLQLVDDIDQEPFLNPYNYVNNGGVEKAQNPVPSNSMKGSTPDLMKAAHHASKFGFNYESLAESIEELELTKTSKELVEKFSQAKYQMEMGNMSEADKILNEMMEKKQIRYKQFSGAENHIMGTFGPISE